MRFEQLWNGVGLLVKWFSAASCNGVGVGVDMIVYYLMGLFGNFLFGKGEKIGVVREEMARV